MPTVVICAPQKFLDLLTALSLQFSMVNLAVNRLVLRARPPGTKVQARAGGWGDTSRPLPPRLYELS